MKNIWLEDTLSSKSIPKLGNKTLNTKESGKTKLKNLDNIHVKQPESDTDVTNSTNSQESVDGKVENLQKSKTKYPAAKKINKQKFIFPKSKKSAGSYGHVKSRYLEAFKNKNHEKTNEVKENKKDVNNQQDNNKQRTVSGMSATNRVKNEVNSDQASKLQKSKNQGSKQLVNKKQASKLDMNKSNASKEQTNKRQVNKLRESKIQRSKLLISKQQINQKQGNKKNDSEKI